MRKQHTRGMKSPRKLMVEGLESRSLLAGNITATITAEGILNIGGDAEANGLLIRQIPTPPPVEGTPYPGVKYELIGSPTKASSTATPVPTTVNAKASVVFEGVKGVNIELRAGNDRLGMSNPPPPAGSTTPPPPPQVVVPGVFNLFMGDGNDEASLFIVNKGGANLNLGSGNDAVSLIGSTVNNMTLNGDNPPAAGSTTPPPGAGDDRIALNGLVASGTVRINSGEGHDGIVISGGRTALAKGIGIATGGGNDGVFINGEVSATGVLTPAKLGGPVNIETGGGNDKVAIKGARAGAVNIATGEGLDEVVLDGLVAEAISALLGAGNDKLNVVKTTSAKSTFGGGDGTDLIIRGEGNSLGTLVVEGFEPPPATV